MTVITARKITAANLGVIKMRKSWQVVDTMSAFDSNDHVVLSVVAELAGFDPVQLSVLLILV